MNRWYTNITKVKGLKVKLPNAKVTEVETTLA